MVDDQGLLHRPGFRIYAAARLTSLGGAAVSWVLMPIAMYSLTGSAWWTALVAAVESLPYLVLGLFAGTIADRVRPRTLMVAADLTSASALLTLPIVYLVGDLLAAHLLAVAIVVQTGYVFFDAANFRLLPFLVGRELLLRANSLLMSVGSVLEGLLPVVAAAALAVVAAPVLLLFTAFTFLTSALLVSRLRTELTRSERSERLARAMYIGLRYLVTDRVAGVATTLSACITVSNGGLMALLVVWANQRFSVVEGDVQLGLFFAAFALADIVGGVTAHQLGSHLGEVRATRLALPAAAVAAYGMLVADDWRVALVPLFLFSVFSGVALISLVTLRQRSTPDELMSRVNTAGRSIAYGAGFAVGALVGGAFAENAGAVVGLAVAFFALVLASVGVWSVLPVHWEQVAEQESPRPAADA